MKLKIIYIILFFIINCFSNYTYADLNIKPNIGWWTYNNSIEINLLSNSENTKIYYYTDWEWRLDNQKEYNWTPIIIKESTTLNYHGFIDMKNSTLINETKYIINYPQNFIINYNNWKIGIKNNSKETINISYWKIEADNISYEIYKNTFLDKWKLYKLDYNGKGLEYIYFISPDNKVKITYQIPIKIVQKNNDLINQENKADDVALINIKDSEILPENNILNNNQIQSFDSKNEKVEWWFDINKHLKTSISDTDTNNKNIIYILIVIFSIWIISKIILYMNKIWIINIKFINKIKKID